MSTPPLAVPPLSLRLHGDRGGAVGVGGRRVGQRAVWRRSAGWAANSAVLLLLTMKVDRLAGSRRRARRDGGGPAGDVCGPASSFDVVWCRPA